MISVKSTKGEAENPDPAAPYAERPVEKPRSLAKAGAWLVAVAVYLKAVLSGSAEAAVPDGNGESQETKGPKPLSATKGDRPDWDGEAPEKQDKFDDTGLEALLTADPHSDTIDFPKGDRGVESPVFKPMAHVLSGANVNTLPNDYFSRFGYFGRMNDIDQVAPPELKRPAEDPMKTPVEDTPAEDTPREDAPGETDSPGEPTGEEPGGSTEEDPGEGEDDPTGAGNRAPRVAGPVYLKDIHTCAILPIGLSDLLRGATDPDGDELHVENVSTSAGHLSLHQNGHWEFSSEGDTGPVEISYLVSDGSLSVQQTLQFEVTSLHDILGTEGDDILVGTLCDDDIRALGGDDIVDGRAGNDRIQGGTGDDHIVAGQGNDWVRGDAGHDIIFGGRGNDILEGGRGDDRLFGEMGDDTIHGGHGDDCLDGGDGADSISGGQGDDRIFGGAGRDLIFGDDGADMIDTGEGEDFASGGAGDDILLGGDGSDRLTGGDGDDRLTGGRGADILLGEAGHDRIEDGSGEDIVHGGAGDDTIVAIPDGVSDQFEGGEGFDRIDYSAATEDLEIDLAAGHATGIEIGQDSISGFEHVTAGAGNDLIRFGAHPVTVAGGAGQNRFEFRNNETGGVSTVGPHTQNRIEIQDFKVGDHLKVSNWDILHGTAEAHEDYEDQVFDDDAAAEIPIRYRVERLDDIGRTIVEANLDGDESYEISFALTGHHSLIIHESTC